MLGKKKSDGFHFSIEKPIKELYQENGSRRRHFVLHANGVEVQSDSKNSNSSKSLSFNNLGLRTSDFEQYTAIEPWKNAAVRLAVFYLMIVASGGVFALNDISVVKESSILTVLVGILGTLMIVGSFVTLLWMVRGQKVIYRKVYFANGGFMSFYYRNAAEIDQVEDFLKAVDKAYIEGSKKEFLEAYKHSPTGLTPWLDALYKHDAFEHEEYQKYLKAIEKADKKRIKV